MILLAAGQCPGQGQRKTCVVPFSPVRACPAARNKFPGKELGPLKLIIHAWNRNLPAEREILVSMQF